MQFILRTLAIFAVAARRLLAQRGLAISTAAGLIASVAIVMSIPLYSDAVYYKILQNQLSRPANEGEIQRPPFAYMFRYVGSLYGLLEWDDIAQLDTYLWEEGAEQLGLPNQLQVRYFRTDNFRLFPASDAAYADVRDPLAWINFATASEFAGQITILEGAWPAVADSNPEVPMEILVNIALAEEFGMQVGEEFITFRRTEVEGAQRVVQVPVRVAGIWQATDPANPYWFYRQSVFAGQFFIPEDSFRLRLVPALPDEIAQALWYFVQDGSEVSADDVNWLLGRINFLQQQTSSILPNTRLEVSPYDALVSYRRSSNVLNVLLYAFSIPIIGLMLAFIGLVVGLAVNRQRNEIAVLRSRGATVLQIMGIAALEALLLGTVALLAGIPFSQQIAQTIGATRSFLNFTLVDTGLRADITMTALRFGMIAVAITMAAQVFPSFGASRHTIISYKREQSRTMKSTWWQRAWLDVLLLIPAAYGTYLLSQQGSISASPESSASPFSNPLLFLIPALGAFALTLFILRLLPFIMAAVAWIAAKTNSVGFLLATRYLSRDPAGYSAPLVLLILTLSLSTFTASLAQTLDAHLHDQTYYQIGADAFLIELGQTTATNQEGSAENAAPTTSGAPPSPIAQDRWVFVPVSEHLNVPEILAAARIGDFNSTIQAGGNWREATMLGIDRLDYPKVAYWRMDFASASLGSLMNSLAIAQNGVLLHREFMQANAISVGDPVEVRITSYGQRSQVNMLVVGDFEYFPTWYPTAEDAVPLMVANLDFIFESLGGEVPYNVLVKTTPEADLEQMTRDLRQYDITVLDARGARARIAEEQRKPERQGLFGVLSVGFLAAALLTVLGFFLYALFSFRRRFIELGTLRAIGLSPLQMTAFLAWELAFVVLLGLGAGTVLGALVSTVYIPYLQVGNTPQALTPPFLVEIAWPAIQRIYILFGALFVVALSVLAALLLRMKIFQAIKLGETV
jgi:putative ABC transport system permease protein